MDSIQGIYIALFGRPADPSGLAYFTEVTNNGADLSAIGNLAGQPEYQTRFTGMSNEEVINSIYQSLFGRDGEAEGLNFFLSKLADGTYNINNIAIAILQSAQGDDLATVNAKIAAANIFTAHLDQQVEVDAYAGAFAASVGRDFINTVNKDDAGTADEADAAILRLFDQGQNPGNGGAPGGGNVPGGGSFNVAPVASDSVGSGNEDADAITGVVTATDGNRDRLTYSVVKDVDQAQGTLSLNAATGEYSFIPAKDYNGQVTFSFAASDGRLTSTPATVTINVAAVNDAPVANAKAESNSGTDQASISGKLLAGSDIDTEAENLTFLRGSDDVVGGSVKINEVTGEYIFTPDRDFNGEASFTYVIFDGEFESEQKTVRIAVENVIDTPEIETVAFDKETDKVTVTGSGEPGSTIVFHLGDIEITGPIVDEDGRFEFEYPIDSGTEGTYEFYATAQKGDKISQASEAETVFVDTRAPAAPTITFDDEDGITNNATPTLTGTAEEGSIVRLYRDGDFIGQTGPVGSEGKWSFDLSELGDDAYEITATATDAFDNTSDASNILSITIDTLSPDLPTIAVAEDTIVVGDNVTKDNTPTLSGKAEAGSFVTITRDGSEVITLKVGETGEWAFTSESLGDGPYVFSVTAADVAGNISQSASLTLEVDTTAPSTPTFFLSEEDGKAIARGTADPGSTVTVSVQGTDYTAIANKGGEYAISNFPANPPSGTYNLTITATDLVGNVSTALESEVNWVANGSTTTVTAANANGKEFLGPGKMVVTGSEGDQTIQVVTNGGNTIDGGRGADIIISGSGNDVIDGGDTATVTPGKPGIPGTAETFTFYLDTVLFSAAKGSFKFDFTDNTLDTTVEYSGVHNEKTIANKISEELVKKGFSVTHETVDTFLNTVEKIGVTYSNVGDQPAVTISEPTDGKAFITGLTYTHGTSGTPATLSTAVVTEASRDVLTGGEGKDRFIINASTLDATDHITDFVGGEDTIKFWVDAVYAGEKSGNGANLEAQVNDILGLIEVNRVALFEFEEKKYFLLNGDGNAVFNAGVDQLVEVTNITGIDAITDATFI